MKLKMMLVDKSKLELELVNTLFQRLDTLLSLSWLL